MKAFWMFLSAAMPWLAMGVAVAIFCVQTAKKGRGAKEKPHTDEKADYEGETHMLDGMCIGMCVGVALGSTGAVDLGTGISLGMLLGLVTGMNIKK